MPRNGSGTYALPAGNPVTDGTTIEASWANATLTDIATALTNSIAKDGETVWTGTDDHNGNEIILDADGDTSITADTDDQIDFKVGGADRVSMTSTAVNITVPVSTDTIFVGNISEATLGGGINIAVGGANAVRIGGGAVRPSFDAGMSLGSASFSWDNTYTNNVLVSGTVFTNTISETTSAAGVTIDGVLLKDSGVTTSGAVTMNTPSTSSTVLTINASMNTGRGLRIASNNSDTSARNLLLIENINAAAVNAVPLQFSQNADAAYINFGGLSSGADTSSAVSTLTTPGAVQGFVQILINGTKRWIAFYADPS